ncbi:DNA-directed DNA polymerase, family B [Kipferlia bialata]|uniref:DNA-directed DNA polymerase n=1 Tax=Kipferlia bialata TaxID=797122 RepID=A0A391P3F8_9EUKA|nr:DNA-directed DNA polymerase, family B [Kipferlia bialata]|eukprot:g6764.t1
MIAMPLSKFGKAFNLDQSKDICPYSLYKGDIVYEDSVPVSAVLPEHFNTPAEYTEMSKRLEGETEFRHMDYLEKYLVLDCEVLVKGLRVHDNSLKEIVKEVVAQSEDGDINPEFYGRVNYFDTLGCFTSASFAHNVMLLSGAYNQHMSYSGPLREWLDKGVIGGRCTLACDSETNKPIRHITDSEGKKGAVTKTHSHSGTIRTQKGDEPYTNTVEVVHHTGFKLIDLDACSLYPSAMADLTSFPTGAPTLFEGHSLQELQEKTYYVAEVRLNRLKARTYYDIPLLCYKRNGILNWFNELPEEDKDVSFVIDKTTFDDLAAHNVFQTEDFDYVQGVYWEENDCRVLKKTITYLYNRRVAIKEEMKQCTDPERRASLDGLQGGVKLIMNSCYGKLGRKSSDYKTIYKNYRNPDGTLHKDYLNYITKKRETIKDVTEVSGGKTVKIKIYQNSYTSFNSSHLSQCILAKSKVIMNRITCLFPRDEIVYTDTDSVQTNLSAFTRAIAEFKELYGYDLEGSDMGQFHPDIDDYCDMEVTYCGRGIYVAKKCYVADKRNPDNLQLDANHSSRYHIRFKGVPGREISKLENPVEVYTKMATGGFAPAPNVVGLDEHNKPILEYTQCLRFEFMRMAFAADSVVTRDVMRRMFRG